MDVVIRLGYALKCIAPLFSMRTLKLNTSPTLEHTELIHRPYL